MVVETSPDRSATVAAQNAEESLFQVGEQKFPRLARGPADSLGGDIPAADGAFHGGGPAGASPVTGEEQVCGGGRRAWTTWREAGERRKRGAHLFHHVRALQLGLAHGGKKLG